MKTFDRCIRHFARIEEVIAQHDDVVENFLKGKALSPQLTAQAQALALANAAQVQRAEDRDGQRPPGLWSGAAVTVRASALFGAWRSRNVVREGNLPRQGQRHGVVTDLVVAGLIVERTRHNQFTP